MFAAMSFYLGWSPEVAKATTYGLFQNDQNWSVVAKNLQLCTNGGYIRLPQNVAAIRSDGSVNDANNILGASEAHELGCKIALTVANIECLGSHGTAISCPPSDIKSYTTRITQVVKDINPAVVNVENEVTADNLYGTGKFYRWNYSHGSAPAQVAAATSADYIAQLSLSIRALVNSCSVSLNGCIVTTDGIGKGALNIAFWQSLYSSQTCPPGGGPGVADEFAALALVPPLSPVNLTSDIPTCANPNYTPFTKYPVENIKLLLAMDLLHGYKSAGVNVLNLHFYWYLNKPLYIKAISEWAASVSGINVLASNEMGEILTTPAQLPPYQSDTLKRMLESAYFEKFNFVLWYSTPHSNIVTLGDPISGALTPAGITYKTFLSNH